MSATDLDGNAESLNIAAGTATTDLSITQTWNSNKPENQFPSFKMTITDPASSAVKMPTCPYCGGWPHGSVESCPQVYKVEYYPDGTIKSVEKR